jgi:guanylate kinase
MSEGKLIVITGPSGVGKGTLVKLLLQKYPELSLSISATTRQPRIGEIEGKDYYFLSVEEFKTMIDQGAFLEWAQYALNYYGTPRHQVETQIQAGKNIILEIEVVGANLIKQNFPDALRIFILPPSVEELEKRLRGRGNDPEEAILKRLNRAKEELAVSDEFDLKIVNDDLEIALQNLEKAIFSPTTTNNYTSNYLF